MKGTATAAPISISLGGRFVLYLALWLVLIGPGLANFIVGVLSAAVATWVSVRLLPLSDRSPSYPALAGMIARLPWQSLLAGLDVARRALAPDMPLKTGYVMFRTNIPAGPARDAFRALMSLQPGTLPVSGGDSDEILFHCLDTDQPVLAQLQAEERSFLRVTGHSR